jgi:phage protein D
VRDLAVMDAGEAQALADAAFDRRARRFVLVEGTAEGNSALRVGTHLKLVGLSPRWDNTYYVVRATHRFDSEQGYRTDFEAECAFLGVS